MHTSTATTTPLNPLRVEISSSTKNALKESVKCFGRLLYKLPYAAAMTVLEATSIGVEALTGVAGGVIGTVAGGVKILARKCMPLKVQKFLGMEKCKTLMEYAHNGFHKGARLGEIPGKLIGAGLATTLATFTLLAAPVTIPVIATATVGTSLTLSGMTFCELKNRKTTVDEFSRGLIQTLRNDFRNIHKSLYGKDTPIKETSENAVV